MAAPFSGFAPLSVLFNAYASGGSGNYVAYNWSFGDTSTSNGNQNPITHIYSIAGVFTPSVVVQDSLGNIGMVTCPTINTNQIIISNMTANAGGPYFGYTNEVLAFDASLSTGPIVRYVWNFGDGTSNESTTPLINHIYVNKIGVFTVKLTVFDANGNSAVAFTKATIVERTTPKLIAPKEDEGLYVKSILIYGDHGEIIRPNDELTVSVDVENDHKQTVKNAKMTVEILDLGIQQKSDSINMNHGKEKTFTTTIPLYNVKPGVYDVKIIVGNDDIYRIKYREIIVRNPSPVSCTSNCQNN